MFERKEVKIQVMNKIALAIKKNPVEFQHCSSRKKTNMFTIIASHSRANNKAQPIQITCITSSFIRTELTQSHAI